MLDGAQKTELTEDMLTDEQKEDLELGFITMEDIRAELGGSIYGERVREYQFAKIAKGFSKGANPTSYTVEDMGIHSIVEEVTEDLFDDDEDEI